MASKLRDWRRYAVVLDARRQGKTLREAGALLGLSGQRAHQMEAVSIMAIQAGVALQTRLPISDHEKNIAARYPLGQKRWAETKNG